jgi:hypothetical protein
VVPFIWPRLSSVALSAGADLRAAEIDAIGFCTTLQIFDNITLGGKGDPDDRAKNR